MTSAPGLVAIGSTHCLEVVSLNLDTSWWLDVRLIYFAKIESLQRKDLKQISKETEMAHSKKKHILGKEIETLKIDCFVQKV